MYEDHFGLAEIPFRVTPDPRFLWWSDQHKEAKEKIMYHITQSVAPIYLIADIGTGKSTLARRIADELSLDKSKLVTYVFAPNLKTTNSFLRFVMDEFGVPTDRSYQRSLKNFENFLIEKHEQGVSPVLLVDEAQNMSRDMLILIQHLFNFSTDTKFLVQMALFAQPELQKKLNRLQSLKSRLSVARLRPFETVDDVKAMMMSRWRTAGGSEKRFPFSDNSIAEIFRVTTGVPRIIVKLSNEALIKAAVDGVGKIEPNIIAAASLEISVDEVI
jgi:general secretion pathway protein A